MGQHCRDFCLPGRTCHAKLEEIDKGLNMKALKMFLLLSFLFSSCAPVQAAPTQTLAPSTTTLEPTETSTPTITPTSIPMIIVDGLSVPDPRITAPELFELSDPNAPISQFVNAMSMVGIDVNDQQIFDELRDPGNYQLKTNINGQEYVQVSFRVTSKNEIGYSIKFVFDQNGGWRLLTFKDVKLTDGLTIGSELSTPRIEKEFGIAVMNRLDKLVIANFNHVILESLAWTWTEREQNSFDFPRSNAAVRLAEDNMLTMEGDDLVYGRQNFKWTYLKDFKANSQKAGLSQEQMKLKLIEIMTNHVTKVVTRYKGRVNQWSVVNEYSESGDDQSFNIIGTEYVELAFQAARSADPNARLYYNGDFNETRQSRNYQKDKKIIQRLRDKGLVDGIGIQMHIDAANPPTEKELIATMQSYGVPVIISSLDISLENLSGSDEVKFQKQAEIAQTILVACKKSDVCKDIYFWDGYGDKYSWLSTPTKNGSLNAKPTPFTDDGLYKPMFFSMVDELSQ